MNWQKTEFPQQAADAIKREGGEPKECWGYHNSATGVAVSVLLSLDPSGRNGQIEKHASVSASTNGVMRRPSPFEMADALNCVRVDPAKCVFIQGSNCIHAFEPTAVKH